MNKFKQNLSGFPTPERLEDYGNNPFNNRDRYQAHNPTMTWYDNRNSNYYFRLIQTKFVALEKLLLCFFPTALGSIIWQMRGRQFCQDAPVRVMVVMEGTVVYVNTMATGNLIIKVNAIVVTAITQIQITMAYLALNKPHEANTLMPYAITEATIELPLIREK